MPQCILSVLICEHNTVNMSVGGLFQLPCVISGVNFDHFSFYQGFIRILFHVSDSYFCIYVLELWPVCWCFCISRQICL